MRIFHPSRVLPGCRDGDGSLWRGEVVYISPNIIESGTIDGNKTVATAAVVRGCIRLFEHKRAAIRSFEVDAAASLNDSIGVRSFMLRRRM